MVKGYGTEKIFDGRIESSILPTDSKMLLDNVKLRNDFQINGGVYGHNIELKGRGWVNGPVMAREEIILVPSTRENEQMLFSSGMSSRKSISVRMPDTCTMSPINDPDFAPLIIKGDVCSNIVHLKNSIILGNIHCTEAYIRDSIVIGIPMVETKLELSNSMVISFDVGPDRNFKGDIEELKGSVQLYGRNTLWLPFAISRFKIEFNQIQDTQSPNDGPRTVRCPHCDVGLEVPELESFSCPECNGYIDIDEFSGEGSDVLNNGSVSLNELPDDWNTSWLRYIGICRTTHGCGEGYISCQEFNNGKCTHEDTRISSEDIMTMNIAGEPVNAATLAPRLLDTTKMERQMNEITDVLIGIMLFGHLDAKSKKIFIEKARHRKDGPIVNKIVKLTELFRDLEEEAELNGEN